MAQDNNHDVLIGWLKTAYSLENSLVNVLGNQAERASSFPEIRSALQGHREASQRHANMVKECITGLDGDVSTVRAGVSKLFGEVQSKMLGTFGNPVVRDAIMGSMSEQLEISTYRAIITLAERLGEEETANTCREILNDEQQMHEFFDEHLENVVNQAYQRELLTE